MSVNNQNPKTLQTPWATAQALKFDVPVDPPAGADSAGRASYSQGFPGITMKPIEVGGTPPWGQDMNGVLYDITSHVAFISRGNFYKFSDEVVAAIGGYPVGACLVPDDPTWPIVLRSAINNNTTNFNTTPAAIGSQWTILGQLTAFSMNYNYPVVGMIVYYNNKMYRNNVITGPATANPATPGTNEQIWTTWTPDAQGEYLNIPDTLCLRDAFGKTQVTDPVEDQDAVPYRFMRNYVDQRTSTSSELAKPVITAPPSGTVVGGNTFPITVTPLEFLAGGTPEPSRTQTRVLSEDLSTIYTSQVGAYTLNPTIMLPDGFPEDTPFWVIVRHENAFTTWSPWSDATDVAGVKLTLSEVYLNRVQVTQPPNGTTNVPLTGVTIGLAAGSWSDGSTFTGSLTRVAIHSESNDSIVWESGTSSNPWISYTTSIAVPDGTLAPNTNYWIEAQHQTATPPSANPSALLTTGAYDKTFSEASRIKTIASSAPNILNLQHDIPAEVMQGSFTNTHIWGATSTDGGAVTYKIQNIIGGLAFAKLTGIVDNETVVMTAPSATSNISCTLEIVAVSSYGASSAPTQVDVLVRAANLIQGLGEPRGALSAGRSKKYVGFGGGGGSSNYISDVCMYDTTLSRTIATSLSQPAVYMGCAGNEEYILFAGGQYNLSAYYISNLVDAYDSNLVKTAATQLSLARSQIKSGSNKNYIVFAGSYTNTTSSGSSTIHPVVVDAYSATLTRTSAPNMSLGARNGFGTGNSKYVMVGAGYDGGAATASGSPPYHTYVDCYDENLTKTVATPLTSPAVWPLAAANETGFMVSGGNYQTSGAGLIYNTQINFYDLNLVKTVASLSTARSEGGGTANNQYFIMSAGRGINTLKTVEAYDSNLTRTLLPDRLVTGGMVMAGASTWDGYFGLIGGGSGSGITTEVDAYDVSLNVMSAL